MIALSNFTGTLTLQIFAGIWLSCILFFSGGIIFSGITAVMYKLYKRRHYRSFATISEGIFDESDQLNILINNIPDAIYIKDSSSKYILANEHFIRLLGLDSLKSIMGKSDSDFYKGDDAGKYLGEDRKIINGELPFIRRKQESNRDNGLRVTLTAKSPVKNRSGQIVGIIGIISDISEQEKASRQLIEKNAVLEKQQILFRALMDNIPDTIYIKDTECNFLDGNSTQVRITKAGTAENLIGKNDFDFYPKDIAEIYFKDDKNILTTGTPVINKEEVGFDADGNIRIKSTTKVPFRDAAGNIIGLVGIGRDISEQKEAEEKLREQAQSLQEINVLLEERQEEINQQSDELSQQNTILEEERNVLRTLIDTIPDYIYLKDKHSHFVTVNKQVMRSFKVDNLDRVIGKTDADFFPDEYTALFLKDDQEILRNGEPIIGKEEPGIDEQGNFIQLLTTKVPLRGSDGEITGIISIARNITNIKEAELKLKEQTTYLKEANVLLEERQEEIQQQSFELTSQNRILENERNLLRTLIDTLPDVIYIKDKESRFIAANKQILDVMKARDMRNLEGKTDFDFYPKELAQIFYDDERRIIETGKPMINKEEIGLDKKGNKRMLSTTKVPFYDAEGHIAGIVGVGRDITEMVEYKERLQEQTRDLQENNALLEEKQEEITNQSESLSEQNLLLEKERNLLRTLIDNMPDYIYIKDKDCRFLTVNKRLLDVMHAKTLDEVVGASDYETAPSKEAAEMYYRDDKRIIESGKPIINKEEIGFDENDRERIMSTSKVPFYDSDGNIAGIVGIGRDITKQKRAEQQLREQAQNLQEVNIILEERQEKIQMQSEELNAQSEILKTANTELEQLNATKNKFFSIIAHDLKNPFQAIFGFSELLLRNFDDFDNPQKMELLGMIKSSSESAYNLLENLLQWARTQTDRIQYSPSDSDIEELIDQNIELGKAGAENKRISLISDIQCDVPVYIDKNMINLVIRNLLSNAIKFTNDEGVVTLSCSRHGKDQVLVSITDTGIGISQENISKLFKIDEYFSTTGTAGEGGTGLGLIICKEFIEKNNGKLTIESKLGEGTTFSFTLPISDSPAKKI
jgi:PAS domain S-box-containing protein